jgi:hypothetical protein
VITSRRSLRTQERRLERHQPEVPRRQLAARRNPFIKPPLKGFILQALLR